uniref:NADH-ubiquinone oxidoreductase chain 1 n=1 Tax=Balclutha impicta TaxID=74069 RepID=O63637_BALIP|nr:NADH dehydrogenase subunit 1 [Balclutha impicta]
MVFIIFLIMLIFIMISVGFFTLLERKVLSYTQCRVGPNKVGFLGLLQPFSDGIKWFMKEQFFPLNSNYFIYMICPIILLFQSLFMWGLFPLYVNSIEFNLGLLFFLCCGGLSVYGLMICGWSSNSSYSLLGCMRSICQAISYEVSFTLILLCFFFPSDSYSFLEFKFFQDYIWFMLFPLPYFLCWLSWCMAESNRSPFDFSEGESELVSGFNVEYGGGGFAYLFIAEYSSIIFISYYTCIIFLGSDMNSMFIYIKLVFLCFYFIWVRSTLPRYRYDKLMYLAWKCYLPLTLNYILFFFFVKSLCFYHFFL